MPDRESPLGSNPISQSAIEVDLLSLQDLAARIKASAVVEACDVELQRLRSPIRPVVVVVGEISKGKSTLINALLGYPELLPVDIDVTTGSYIRLTYGDSPLAVIFAEGQESGTTVDLHELSEWVSVGSNPDNRKGVRFAEVSIPSPILASGIDIVDTPGIGGLVGAHTALTLSVIRQADALLFVSDVFTPITAQEIEFLRLASESVPVIRIVVNKIDATSKSREVIEEDLQILREQVPMLAETEPIPTSARAAVRMLRRSDSVQTPGPSDRSGLDRLHHVLSTDVVRVLDVARFTVADTMASQVASKLCAQLESATDAYNSREACQKQLREQQAALDALLKIQSNWREEFRNRMAQVAQATGNRVQDESAELRWDLEDEIDGNWKKERLETFEDEVQSRLLRVAQALADDAHDAVLGVLRDMGAMIGDAALEFAVPDQGSDTRPGRTSSNRPMTAARVDLSTKLRLTQRLVTAPMNSRSSATSLLGTGVGALFSGAFAPIMVALGLGNYAMDLRASARANEQRAARRQVANVMPRWERDLRQLLDKEIWQTFRTMAPKMDGSLGLRIQDLQSTVGELKARASAVAKIDGQKAQALIAAGRTARQIVATTSQRLESYAAARGTGVR